MHTLREDPYGDRRERTKLTEQMIQVMKYEKLECENKTDKEVNALWGRFRNAGVKSKELKRLLKLLNEQSNPDTNKIAIVERAIKNNNKVIAARFILKK
jgi:hypothetical protein